MRRRWTIILAVAIIVIVGVIRWRHSQQSTSVEAETAIAQIQPLDLAVTIAGTIVAADKIEVSAPFDSVVRTMPVRLGQTVTEGQVLVSFDTAELSQRAREAEAAALKAAQAFHALTDWTDSLDAARARRSRAAAQATAADNLQRLRETEALFRDGIVPRSELESLRQQVRSDQGALASANDEWRALQVQASPANRRVAEIDYRNAVERLDTARKQLANATLVAPRAGTLVRPQVRETRPSDLMVGASVTRGQPLFAIADRQRLGVLAKIDETDANRLKEGQRIEVSGPAFATPAYGHIVSIEAEAMPDSAPGTASYVVRGALDPLPPKVSRLLRLGMTATIRVVVDSRPRALVVPPAAIQGTAPNTQATVKHPDDNVLIQRVRTGLVSEQGVEILDGLKPGDVVLLQK